MQRPARITREEAGEYREDAASISDTIDVLYRRYPHTLVRALVIAVLSGLRNRLHRQADQWSSDFPPASWWPRE